MKPRMEIGWFKGEDWTLLSVEFLSLHDFGAFSNKIFTIIDIQILKLSFCLWLA